MLLYLTWAPQRARNWACTPMRATRSAISTMSGLGLKPGDAHLNISSPGWARHAGRASLPPWNAGAAILALSQRIEPRAALDALVEHKVTVFCAPPTVWRMLIQHALRQWKVVLREVDAAGEPVNPEIIEQVARAWACRCAILWAEDTTMMIGNSPGQKVVPGSIGRPCRATGSRSLTPTGSRATPARSRCPCAHGPPA